MIPITAAGAPGTAGASGGQGWLAVGGLHHLNGTAPAGAAAPIVLAPLARPMHDTWPSNTVQLDWRDLGPIELRARSTDGRRRAAGQTTGERLFDRLLPGPELTAVAAAVTAGREVTRPWATPLVPLFYLAARPAGTALEVHVYSQIRFLAEDACFIRLTPEPVRVPDVEGLGWLPEAVERHRADFLFLNNHQRYYRKCFPGRELEYKYTIDPPTADIWTLTARLCQRLADRQLAGYLPEYHDEFQAWDYTNYLFQVTGPEADRGYVSFIPTTDGANLVKRKWFARDGFDRRETHTYGVLAERGFDAYVGEELGVRAVRLPPFRRARYDVNFESVRTGHVYGIFFDTVSLLDAPEVQLQQCELEYLRSRTVVEPDPGAVLAEIEEIAQWLEGFLRECALPADRGYYSKLSFLLDAVAGRPELAVTGG